MRIASLVTLVGMTLLLVAQPLFAQGAGVAWSGPGPSANVRAFGAYGDTQEGNNGSATGTTLTASTSTPFVAGDIGKHLWIDHSPFPLPTLPTMTVGSCANGKLENHSSYSYHLYFRITFTNGGSSQGNPSFEGIASISPGSGQCATIAAPGSQGTGASNYKVYFAADAPARWTSNTFYSSTPASFVLDTNGNIEKCTSCGNNSHTGSDPPWTTVVGGTTTDGFLTWTNQGPVVPGGGSGTEVFAGATATNCTAGQPSVSATCEIDNVPPSGGAPPAISIFDAGTITGVPASNMVTFSNTLGSSSVSKANYAWGHDDTTAITNALGSLTALPLVPGGTLFFPQGSGCYAVSSSIMIASSVGSFLNLAGEGSASSKSLGGPGTVVNQPASACIATIGASSGFSFSSSGVQLNAGPLVERLGFLDPFGATAAALTFNTNASTRVIYNSFQGYASGVAILFNGGQPNDTTTRYSQFVEASNNVCTSVVSCIVMNQGITNPSWIERNRCVSAQTGGGRCVQLGPNIPPTSSDPPNTGGATNWIVENFGLYFPITFESIDQNADYWIANSDQETSSQAGTTGSSGTGTGLHIGSSATGMWCFDNEVIGGNTTTHNPGTGLFIDAPCTNTLYIGYTVTDGVADFSSASSFWTPESGLNLGVPSTSPPNAITVKNRNGNVAFEINSSGNPVLLDTSSGNSLTLKPPTLASSYSLVLPASAGSSGQPLLSGGTGAMTFGNITSSFVDSTIKGFASTSATNINPTAGTDTQLAEFALPAGYLNSTNKSIRVYAAGLYSTAASQTPTLLFKIKLCSVSGCATGTVVGLMQFGASGATTASVTNAWKVDGELSVVTSGASGTLEAHGLSYIQLGMTGGTLSPEIRTDANTNVSSAIDLTGALFLDVTIRMSTNAGSNTAVARLVTASPIQ